MFNRSLTLNIAMGCISYIISGYYDLYVYDVENDNTLSLLPAIIMNRVFVNEQTIITTTEGTTEEPSKYIYYKRMYIIMVGNTTYIL